ncbi:MAG: thioredoxin family protein [Deltaproteobacteria bacterium]|nr:thioredoxin family protein [Deltaproteobacteria bacterium]
MTELILGTGLAAVAVALLARRRIDLYDPAARVRAWNAGRVVLLAAGIALAWPPAFDLARSLVRNAGAGTASLPWRADAEAALADAKAREVPAVLDAGAEWCAACKELEHVTFTDEKVAEALSGFVPIRVDMTDFDAAQARLAAIGIDIGALPWVGFFLPDGRLNPGVTLTDFEAPGDFVARVKLAGEWRERPPTPVEAWIAEHGLLLALLLVFWAGVGVSLTPCVYPLIPITVSVVGAREGGPEGPPAPLGRRIVRSGAFVGGLLVTYTALGVVSALLGKGFGSWLQHPAVTIGMAALLAALAASYLGFFQLDLPQSLKARIGKKRGGLAGVALVGAGTGFLAAPCAGPVVVGILAVISGTGDVLLGTLLMAVFALGMGMLFFGLGLSTALLARLPRGGTWMEWVEVGFAVVLLVVAIHYGRMGVQGFLA